MSPAPKGRGPRTNKRVPDLIIRRYASQPTSITSARHTSFIFSAGPADVAGTAEAALWNLVRELKGAGKLIAL